MSLIHAFAALCIVLACAPVAQAQDAVIGLLALPQLFGNHTCDRFVPEQIRLYTAPDSGSLVGSIRVDSNWTFADNGGCEGLQVSVHAAATGLRSELPTREFGYEEPGAIVVDRHADWFRIKMHDGYAWLHASPPAEYHPLERMLTESLAYLTDAIDEVRVVSSGGELDAEALTAGVSSGREVRVLEFQRREGALWLRIDLLSHSPCESVAEPVVTQTLWVPAHGTSGEPTVWFYSRGC